MRIPKDERGLIKLAQELIEVCGVSQGSRGAAYQSYSQLIETGRAQGGLSLTNTLFSHIDRLSSHLYCPTEARFAIDFQNVYDQATLLQADQVARILTRAFSLNNFDLAFAGGVSLALGMGSAFLKITGKTERITIGDKSITHIKSAGARIVPPWLMGVENEARNGLAEQEAILETVYLNKHDVWRRIAHLPDAEKLYKRILAQSNKSSGPGMPSSYVQVLSTSNLNISPQGSQPQSPGGIVQMTGDPNYSTVGPQVLSEMIQMWELWVWDDDRNDYLMIQMIAPDVLIAPRHKRINEFCDDTLPYVLIQPNEVSGYFWGRSEIIDVIGLQGALTETMDDFRRLIGVQYDKRLAFEGFDGDPQELYDDFRSAGFVSGRAGSKVTDLTPSLPPGALEYIKLIRTMMEDISGFGNILSGQGEAGVRAGNHAETLVKTASPRLRDRSLVVERQYATFGDTYLHYLEAKDGNQYYTDPEKPEESAFLLDQLPDDRRVMVDSHSSSPIYENDHNSRVAFGLKMGLIQGDDAIDMLNFPNRDELKRKWKKQQDAQAALIKEHPELLAKGGGRRK
jgi:hypothetical protein